MFLTVNAHFPRAVPHLWKDEACSGKQSCLRATMCFLQDAALRLLSRFQNKNSAFALVPSPPPEPRRAAWAVLTLIAFSHHWHQATHTSSVDKTSV